MKEKKPDILYSDPIKEIMGNPPGRILRWGTVILFCIFLLFVLFAWLVKYPDIIPAPVEITTTNPPVTLVSKVTGRIIEKNVSDNDTVKTGQVLAVVETTASVQEIDLLKETFDTINNPMELSSKLLPEFSELGELQAHYASFQKAFSDLNSYIINDINGSRIRSLAEEINGIQEYIDKLRVQENLYIENQKLQENQFKRILSLNVDSVVAEAEMELASQSLIGVKKELIEVQLAISEKSLEMYEKKHDLENSSIIKRVEEDNYTSILRESFSNLKAQIDIWENLYLLKSPIDGIVSFPAIWSANQSVMKDDPVINIVPLETGDFLGRINLKMQRSGKVKTGLKVNIKLSAYPYLEYGMVRGIVKSISLVPSGDTYIIELDIPEGLTTGYGGILGFQQRMQGTAEIITEDVSLLQRIVNPFRHLISKNRR